MPDIDELTGAEPTINEKRTVYRTPDNAPVRPRKEESLTMEEQKLLAIFNSLPEYKKAEGITLLEDFAKKTKHQPPPLPDHCPLEKTYDHWKTVNHSKDGIKCLEESWGPWLKAFNPSLDRDYMSQADLGKLDSKLLIRLRSTYLADDLNEFLPSLAKLNAQIVSDLTRDEKREIYRKAVLVTRHAAMG